MPTFAEHAVHINLQIEEEYARLLELPIGELQWAQTFDKIYLLNEVRKRLFDARDIKRGVQVVRTEEKKA